MRLLVYFCFASAFGKISGSVGLKGTDSLYYNSIKSISFPTRSKFKLNFVPFHRVYGVLLDPGSNQPSFSS